MWNGCKCACSENQGGCEALTVFLTSFQRFGEPLEPIARSFEKFPGEKLIRQSCYEFHSLCYAASPFRNWKFAIHVAILYGASVKLGTRLNGKWSSTNLVRIMGRTFCTFGTKMNHSWLNSRSLLPISMRKFTGESVHSQSF